jgi:hypothetical protein
MPADNIERSLVERIPEPVLAWCNGQSMESRYSPSVRGPVGVPAAQVGATGVLRHQFSKARREDAVPMPRFPVIAATAERIYVFDGPLASAEPLAVLDRSACQILVSGKAMWHRLDVVYDGPPPRSYTTFFNLLVGSRRRLNALLAVLDADR